MGKITLRFSVAMLVTGALAPTACSQKMADQPSYRPLTADARFPDQMSSRPLVAGTVSRESLQTNEPLYQGTEHGKFIDYFPIAINRQTLERGQQRFEIYCAPCHGLAGAGDGMVVRRGFSAPPELYIDRLIKAPNGYLFSIATNGKGAMYSYADRVSVQDRWAIVSYIRALQMRHGIALSTLPSSRREQIKQRADEGTGK